MRGGGGPEERSGLETGERLEKRGAKILRKTGPHGRTHVDNEFQRQLQEHGVHGELRSQRGFG